MNIFVLFLVIFALCYVWLMKRRNFWSSRGFPSSELIFPFGSLKGVGNKISLVTRLDEYYREFKQKGPAVGLFFFVKPTLLLTSPELIKSVLLTNFDCFHDRVLYHNKEDDPLSANLLTLDGE